MGQIFYNYHQERYQENGLLIFLEGVSTPYVPCSLSTDLKIYCDITLKKWQWDEIYFRINKGKPLSMSFNFQPNHSCKIYSRLYEFLGKKKTRKKKKLIIFINASFNNHQNIFRKG